MWGASTIRTRQLGTACRRHWSIWGRFGQHVGVWLAATTGAEDAADLEKLFAALPTGSVTLNFDPGALILNGFSPSEVLHRLGEHVTHVHATDAVRDRAQGRGLETQLGRGAADFPELAARLEEHEYRGYFHAAAPPGGRPRARDRRVGAVLEEFGAGRGGLVV